MADLQIAESGLSAVTTFVGHDPQLHITQSGVSVVTTFQQLPETHIAQSVISGVTSVDSQFYFPLSVTSYLNSPALGLI